ncbi:TolC family protein [Anaerovorax sp. IOR16]|uniref:TolC family protein n=1 Tax=Anaerovorax sp. IOR16 TaxID=2773458 RepID=UPI0019D16603|nr:TolC family protein [Anaerovorax sp. IOR16]
MNKKSLSWLLVSTLILSASTFAFAEEVKSPNNIAETTIAETKTSVDFTGVSIKLSLKDAIKRMQTQGIDAEAAELNKKADQAIAAGYSESARRLYKELQKSDGLSEIIRSSGESVIQQKVSKLTRDFAQANVENNYKADMNRIESDTINLYYNILQAQDSLKAAEDHFKTQKTILNNVQKKFDLGVAAKIDLQSAKTGLATAETGVLEAKIALDNLKMAFNIRLGYPLMQSIAFTDRLETLEMPSVTLDKAIANAKANRMEIKRAKLDVETKAILLDHLQYTVSKTSSTYLNEKVSYMRYEQNLKNQPLEIEKEIRKKYMELQEAKAQLQTEKDTAALAKEKYRLAMISYDAGLKTLTDVQSEEISKFEAEMNLAKAIANYDLAVYAYQYAQGVGTERISL